MKIEILIHLAICVLGARSFEMAPELRKIFQGLSWPSRMRLLNKHYPDPNPANWSANALLHERTSARPISITTEDGTKKFERLVAIEALRQPIGPPVRRRLSDAKVIGSHDTPSKDDESHMKSKLFRLMYESIRDSDLKVRRAELIKTHYTNSSSFEVGYLLGEVTEQFHIMTDIAVTVKRLYQEWKPIEHINAYEQIANQAIEISHLIEIVRSTHKLQTTLQAMQNKKKKDTQRPVTPSRKERNKEPESTEEGFEK